VARIRVRAELGIARHMPGGQSETTLDIAERDTVGQILSRLGVPENAVSLILVNREVADAKRTLSDGDEVSLLPFIVGG
jgi:sulfur carrier protein ThiS